MTTNGLTDKEVEASRLKHGDNVLTPVKRTPWWHLYLEKYQDPIIQILMVAAAISLVLAIIEHQYVETIGIFIAIFLATTVGFFFEMDAARKFDVLTQLNEEQKVKVIRNGEVQLISRKDIVVGDVVMIETGDEVPADGVLDECNSLQIDESMLTGEPLATKTPSNSSGESPLPTSPGESPLPASPRESPLPASPRGGENLNTLAAEKNDEQNIFIISSPRGGREGASEGASEGGSAAYSQDFVMRSTMVMNGRGRFVVTAVGDATEIGKVAKTSTEKTEVKTPLNLQLDRLGKIINKLGFSLSVGAAILFLGHDLLVNPLWRSIGEPGADYVEMASVVLKYFMMAVSLIVMAVPEGLPMAVTLSLALNMRRMLKSNNLVRKLHACETMGAVTVICTDKTGTLTQNKMQVAEWRTLPTSPRESPLPASPRGGDYLNDSADKTNGQNISKILSPSGESEGGLDLLYEAIATNTTANIGADGNGIGNPTEVALLLWLKEHGVDYRKLRNSVEIVEQVPFSTETKQMVTVVKSRVESIESKENSTRIYIKGAPEIILAQCDMTDEERKEVEAVLLGYQQKAMRTLALAYKCSSSLPLTGGSGWVFQAVFGISDPIRPDVPAAVKQCNDAGIEVKIVTGDVTATAMEIAKQIGLSPLPTSPRESPLPTSPRGGEILNTLATEETNVQNISKNLSPSGEGLRVGEPCSGMSEGGYCISGADFSALSDEEAMKVARNISVMSRARPQDKQRLVRLLQQSGEVVAVTGDGTNDAPALNYAHVGLSLGSGTNVAKEASDMTLLDDSFGSIANAVMWGRSLYKNLQRFLYFQLTVNVAALLLVIGGSLIGTEMPLTVTQILWVNLIMDTFAALALSSLAPSREVMTEKPRKQTDFILTRSIIMRIIGTGLLMFAVMFVYLIYCEYGFDLFTHNDSNKVGVDIHELTRFFTVFVMMQMWNLFNARTIGSRHSCFRRLWAEKGLLLVIFCIVIGQWIIVTFGGEMFRCVPLSWLEWLVIIAVTSPVMLIGKKPTPTLPKKPTPTLPKGGSILNDLYSNGK